MSPTCGRCHLGASSSFCGDLDAGGFVEELTPRSRSEGPGRVTPGRRRSRCKGCHEGCAQFCQCLWEKSLRRVLPCTAPEQWRQDLCPPAPPPMAGGGGASRCAGFPVFSGCRKARGSGGSKQKGMLCPLKVMHCL